jgi:hypothetical protein
MNAGARFSPVRTMRFVSEVARRQRSADFAFRSAVSIPFIATPSMAWDSTRLPPQSRIAIATADRFWVAHSVQASARARAAALVRIFWFRVTSMADDVGGEGNGEHCRKRKQTGANAHGVPP